MCRKRKLAFDDTTLKEKLINILHEDDCKPRDWGESFSLLLYHTSIPYEEICRRTIPQINAIQGEAGINMSMKFGLPFKDEEEEQGLAKEPPKLSQFAAFANMFNGIR